MKKLKTLFILLLLVTGFSLPHIHNKDCGYNPETKTGCIYEIDRFEHQDPRG